MIYFSIALVNRKIAIQVLRNIDDEAENGLRTSITKNRCKRYSEWMGCYCVCFYISRRANICNFLTSKLRGLVLHGKMYISNDDAARRKATALEARVYLPMRVYM
jgi:hypothetical protein